ncbi:uncharacterized protein VNE69_02116 [Vairimorpha necatrix]|uniref:Uncharacterized protein n=1 Tax=Vairimorpha necatrix TaxID=6039 RepID=A0AAX4J9K0_9MICR
MFIYFSSLICSNINININNGNLESQNNCSMNTDIMYEFETILAEKHNDLICVDMEDIYTTFEEMITIGSQKKIKDHNQINEMFFNSNPAEINKIKDQISHKMKFMKETLHIIVKKNECLLQTIPIKILKIKLDRTEYAQNRSFRSYLCKKYNSYRDKIQNKLLKLIDTINDLDQCDNKVIIEALKFIVDIINFIIPKSYSLKITYYSLQLKSFLLLDYWKLETVLKNINISELITLITNYYNNKIKKTDEHRKQILKDFTDLHNDYSNFCIQKDDIYLRIYKIIKIIIEKHKSL